MKLEDEIQQKSFKTPYHKLAVNLIYTSNWLSHHFSSFLKETNITIQQYNVLRILRGQHPKPCSLKLVKERMLDRMSDASRIVDKLVSKEYIERASCPNDRRSINLLISEKGLKLLESLDPLDASSQETFKNLELKQVEQLNNLLDMLRG